MQCTTCLYIPTVFVTGWADPWGPWAGPAHWPMGWAGPWAWAGPSHGPGLNLNCMKWLRIGPGSVFKIMQQSPAIVEGR